MIPGTSEPDLDPVGVGGRVDDGHAHPHTGQPNTHVPVTDDVAVIPQQHDGHTVWRHVGVHGACGGVCMFVIKVGEVEVESGTQLHVAQAQGGVRSVTCEPAGHWKMLQGITVAGQGMGPQEVVVVVVGGSRGAFVRVRVVAVKGPSVLVGTGVGLPAG